MASTRRESRAPRPNGQYVSDLFTSVLPISEMKTSRGSRYRELGIYQIRIKPLGSSPGLLDRIKLRAEEIGVSVQVNSISPCSSKFPSVSFNLDGLSYDIVLARGENKGESFEKHLLNELSLLVQGEYSELGLQALEALHTADTSISIYSVDAVKARTGRTNRSINIPLNETGKIIADIILYMKDGTEKYLSIKNKAGGTVGQLGLAGAFNSDLSVNLNSEEWITWLDPLNLDHQRITDGLRAYKQEHFIDELVSYPKIKNLAQLKENICKLWGCNYIYLRETSNGFCSHIVDRSFLDTEVLDGLIVTEIRYPSNKRKQISVYLQSNHMRFKLEVRNPDGVGIRPTQIQLSTLKSSPT